MATTTQCLIIFLLLNFIILLFNLSLTKANVDFIVNTCKNTDNVDFCVSTLESEKRSFDATTVAELTEIAIDIATATAGSTLSHINDLANQNPGTDLEEALHQCAQLYGNAIDDLGEVGEDVRSGDYGGAAELVVGPRDAPGNCERAFTDRSLQSPVANEDKNVEDKCGLCADLIDLLNSCELATLRYQITIDLN